eukprot:1380127-Amorphochlora_amoeboformis.AAC.1
MSFSQSKECKIQIPGAQGGMGTGIGRDGVVYSARFTKCELTEKLSLTRSSKNIFSVSGVYGRGRSGKAGRRMRRGTLISRRSSIGRRGGGDLEGIWWEKDWPLFNDTELLA